jgi:TrmH family RNA methyltransferase
MISKGQIKNIRFLQQKKYRDEQRLFIAEGPKVVVELLNSKFKTKELFYTEEFKHPGTGIKGIKVSEKELQNISALKTANQVLAVFEIPELKCNTDTLKKELVLALDDIRDPGNMGTIIRIADWFGINHVLCSESCVDVFNPKVVQSTMGSIARVNVCSADLDMVLKELQPVYAAVLNGKNIYSTKLTSKGVILIGNESKGISEKLMKHVSDKISIPNFSSPQETHSAGAESLNAAIATAIICSEFRRK